MDDLRNERTGESEGLLAGFPGAALLVRGNGQVAAANAKGAGVEALLRHNAIPEVLGLIEKAALDSTLAVGTVSLAGTRGEVLLEVTVVPRERDNLFLVLARDLTMERNLRSALVESRQRYKDLVEVSSDFAWEVGPEGQFVFVSSRGALGYAANELVGRRPEQFVRNADEYDPLPFVSDRPLSDVELWMNRAEGEVACVLASCVPLLSEKGEWRGTRGVCRDVTVEREQEAALARARHREQLLNYIVSTVRDEVEPLNMLTAAAAATGRALAAAGCRIFRQQDQGYFAVAAEHGTVVGLEKLADRLTALESDGGVLELEIGHWVVLLTATQYRQAVNGAVALWRDGAAGAWDDDARILVGDVANQLGIANEQIANHEHIVKMSRTDPMTGMLNRRAFFEEELPRRIARLVRANATAALFYVDMDNFKRVNDVHGHHVGDEAILALRDMLLEHSRPGDQLARLGGDEFAMWLDGIPPETTIKRATVLIEDSKSLQRYSGDAAHPLGISLGIALFDPATGESLDDLLARADAAMYAIKRAGKGGYRLAEPPGTAVKAS
ncbi:MAG: sensor domain-containing diguanylate cyclase [Magnetospirillum sp. WYHS-4]